MYTGIYVSTISNAFRVLPLPYKTWACGTKLLICTANMNHISEQLLQWTKSTVVVAGFKRIRRNKPTLEVYNVQYLHQDD